MQSRRLVRPIDPSDEARLRSLKAALADLPLGEATRGIEQGLVTDAGGRPVPWRPVAAVIPVSERLMALVSGPAYEDAAARRIRTPRLSFRACRGRIGIPPEGASRMTPRLFPACASFALISLAAATASPSQATAPPSPAAARPRLVLFVAVDQMRADYLDRFRPLFTGGFKRLVEGGAVFTEPCTATPARRRARGIPC